MTTPQNPLDDPVRMGRGPTAVRYAVARYLKDAYPTMRQRALNQWKIKPLELPSIEKFTPIEAIEIASNSGPILSVEVRNASNIKATDLTDYGSVEYRVPYDVRIGIYLYSQSSETGIAAAPQRASAVRMRDDQVQVIRACLLDRQSLGTDFLTAQPSTLSISYQAPTPVGNNSERWAISGELAIEVVADEYNTLTALGRVGETGVEAEIILDNEKPGFPYLGKTK